jgi:predicted transcriptional regulator
MLRPHCSMVKLGKSGTGSADLVPRIVDDHKVVEHLSGLGIVCIDGTGYPRSQLACRAACRVLRCLTMRSSTITIRLDGKLDRELARVCAQTGRTRSDLARDALRRQIALLRFERLRAKVLPLAEARGYLTDDDVFRELS